jgi:hypothetical protein
MGAMSAKSPNFVAAYPNALENPPNPEFAQMTSAEHLLVKHNFQLPPTWKHIQPSDPIAEFYPVVRKGPNYLKHCTGWLSKHEKPASIRDCIWKYTSGEDWFCSTINMALATDSPTLEQYGEYVKHLKYSIGMSPMHFTGTVFRGKSHRVEFSCMNLCNHFFFHRRRHVATGNYRLRK